MHPDVVTNPNLTGKTARYLAASSTIESLILPNNQLGSATYLAVAAALRVNSSLRVLYLSGNQAVDRTRIEAAFIEALRLNPDRPAASAWYLYSSDWADIDFKRLRDAADELGHPSLQLLLAARLLTDDRPTGTLRH